MLRIFEDQKVSDSLRSVAAAALFPKSLLPRVRLTHVYFAVRRTAQFAAAPLRRTAVALRPPSANSVKHRNTSRLQPARRRSAAFNRRPTLPHANGTNLAEAGIFLHIKQKSCPTMCRTTFLSFSDETAYWPLAFSSSNALLYFSYLACMPSSSRRRNVRAFSDSTVRRSLGFSS